jgi:hypothetical protein
MSVKFLQNVLTFHSFAFYIDDSCRTLQVNKDLRTLNNVTGLFDGGCVRNWLQDATDIVGLQGIWLAAPHFQWQSVVAVAVNLWTTSTAEIYWSYYLSADELCFVVTVVTKM